MNDRTPSPASSPARPPGPLPWLVVGVGLAIAYAPMWLPPLGRAAGLSPGVDGPASSIVWNALAVTALLAHVLVVERRPLASLGISRPRAKDLEWAMYLFGIAMTWQSVVLTLWPPPADDGTATLTAQPVAVVLALVVSAAVFEEILCRGYPIERLSELTGRRTIAFALTVPLFVAPHVAFFGLPWLWTAGAGTVAIYVLYAITRNLPACMLLHLGVNLPILIPTIGQRLAG